MTCSRLSDDHSRFSSHMSQSSWMMGGGRISIELDSAKGQVVGSHIGLSGTVLGIRLSLGVGVPTVSQTLSVGGLRRVTTSSKNGEWRLRVFIDYDLPTGWATRWLGFLFGGLYAQWCVRQIVERASIHFGARGAPEAV